MSEGSSESTGDGLSRLASALAGTVLLLTTISGCGAEQRPAATTTPTRSPGELPQSDDPWQPDPEELSPDVTNDWFPLEPGTRWTYVETNEDGARLEVVVTVTTKTLQIANGATARVVRDTVTLDGQIMEDTFDWYAQDPAGTVWYLGEDTAELEHGEITSREGSFEAGVDGALPGVIMPGDPTIGMTYRQEYAQGVAADNGAVIGTGRKASVPAGTYVGLLQTADTNALDPGALEHKYYARGLGLVLTVDVESGGREELVAISRISAAEARRAGTAGLGESY